jgi:AraC-like DNA-binding protein
MKYSEHILDPFLSEYVQSLWSMEAENDQDVYPRSQIMPDGIVELVFHYGDPLYTYQDGQKHLQSQNFAISMMRKFIELESSGRTGFIAARFFPWGAYHFFDEPIQNFLDQSIDAKKLWSDSENIIVELKKNLTVEERFKLVERFLLEKFKVFKKDESKTDTAIKLIREAKGALSVEEVCQAAGVQKKTLERKFMSTVGTTPKVISRIMRFLNICNHLEDYRHKTLTELTYECGYYDQAHFIKEFKEFSGFTPKEYFEKKNVYFTTI